MRRDQRKEPTPIGPIHADEILPLRAARERLGVGEKGLAQMRRAGLKVRRFGRQGYIVGADAIQFFKSLPADDEHDSDTDA